MVCIYCNEETRVYNSRHQKRENKVWRRRVCLKCGAAFTTNEAADLVKGIVFKSKSFVEPFLRDKVLLSVNESLKHRKTAIEDSMALTDTIISHCLEQAKTSGEITRGLLVKVTITTLERFDEVAATHYEAFHPRED